MSHCWNLIGTLRSLWPLEQNPEFTSSTRDEALFPCSDPSGMLTCPLQLERWSDVPEEIWEVPWTTHHNSRGTPKFPPQSEKNHDIPCSTWDETWFPCNDSRAIPRSLSQLIPPPHKGRLYSLYATLEVQGDTCSNSRGIPSFPVQLEKSPVFLSQLDRNPAFPTSTRIEALLPCSDLKEFPRCRSEFERRPDLPEVTGEVHWGPHPNLRRTPSFSWQLNKKHEIPFQREMRPISPAVTQENPVFTLATGKKAWLPLCNYRRAPNTRCNWKGNPSFPPHLEKFPVFTISSRDEDRFTCFDSRGIPTFLSALKRKTVSSFVTPEEHWGSWCKSKR